jgi:hypothetical protein
MAAKKVSKPVMPYRPFSGYIPDGVISQNGYNKGFPFSQNSFDPLDPEIDLVWGGSSREDSRFSSYYDYYFSGEDVKIYIDGLFNPADELEISNFSFSIKQEKQPLYGFWSYNYDAIMYGSRIVAGAFSIFTRHPRRMTELLEKAARIRSESVGAKNAPDHVISTLSSSYESAEDEINIQKYWARSQLDRITNDPANKNIYPGSNKHIFSAHPPFNLVIIYGVQENGLVAKTAQQQSNGFNKQDNLDRLLTTDHNTRLTKVSNQRVPMKIVLQNVQLTSMSTGYDTSGAPLQEMYEFMSRDIYYTIADESTNPLANINIDPTTQPGATTGTDNPNTQVSGPGSVNRT